MDVYQNMISRQKEIFSEEEQEILRTTPIVIIGCGGLGGTIIEQFVRAGFEELTIVDQDVFDETNLNRQVRSNLDTVGKSKVKITKSASLYDKTCLHPSLSSSPRNLSLSYSFIWQPNVWI